MLQFLIINWFFTFGFQPAEYAMVGQNPYIIQKNSITTELGISATAWDRVTLSGSIKTYEFYEGVVNYTPSFNLFSIDSKIGLSVRVTPNAWKVQSDIFANHDCRHNVQVWHEKIPFDYNYANTEIGIKFYGSL